MVTVEFNELLNRSQVLARNWAPVDRGEGFVWRDLRNLTMSAARRHELEGLTREATNTLKSLARALCGIDDELRLHWRSSPHDAVMMQGVLELLDDRPRVPTSWLTADSLDPVEERASELARMSERYQETVGQLSEELGDRWMQLDVSRAPRARAALDGCKEDLPPWNPANESSTKGLVTTFKVLQEIASRSKEIEAEGRMLSAAFGMREEDLSVQRIAELADLASLVDCPDAPEPDWLSPGVQAPLGEAALVLGELSSEFRAREYALAGVFTPAVLGVEDHGNLPRLDH